MAVRPPYTSLRRLADKFRFRLHGSGVGADAAALHNSAPIPATAGRIRPRHYRFRYGAPPPYAYRMPPATTGIDIARFGLLSVATLPFTAWIAYFTYDYVYRVDICREALTKQDAELTTHQSGDDAVRGDGGLLGRDKELAEVSNLLSQDPSQIIVIAGGNEAGKSKFVSELLRRKTHRLSADRGVTYVQLAQLVDSLSSFTQELVHSFELRWLRLRHALVDVLPFAGSEILVMKERFSGRDLAAALLVATEALKQNADENPTKPRPVIVIDGLGEGHGSWMGSSEGQMLVQRLMQWCVYVTKERRLAHVVLTGNEQLVLSLTDQNRITRGHVKVVGLGDLQMVDAAKIVKTEIPDASDDEIKSITAVFGGFIHDVKGVSRDIQYRLSQEQMKSNEERKLVFQGVVKARFQQQIERVVAAFAQAKERDDSGGNDGSSEVDEDDMDPYLDPLKLIYSEAQASQSDGRKGSEEADDVGWTQLQLWQTILRIVESPNQAVSFSELRDETFDGDKTGLMDLMREDVLGFQVDRSSDGGWLWKVTPASPALGRAFRHLVDDSDLKTRFDLIEMEEEKMHERQEVEAERVRLYRERKILDSRKKSLLRTIELGKELERTELAQQRLAQSFEDIVTEEAHHDDLDRLLRDELNKLSINRPDGGDAKTSDGEMHTCNGNRLQRQETVINQLSLQDLLRDAVLGIVTRDETIDTNGDDDRFARIKRAFEVLDVTKDGKIEATDLIRVVKDATGEKVGLKDAKDLISEWDINDDGSLDYQELTRMLLLGQGSRKASNKEIRREYE